MVVSSSDHSSFSIRASDSDNGEVTISPTTAPSKDFRFWLIFVSMCICPFLSALELPSVSTALPTISHELRASQFAWVGSAYALSSTAFLPMSGGIAQTFGRRPAILISIGLFATGSGICGGANSMHMLIAGRTIQGLGGGGIQSVTGIILADLVSLQQRGAYSGGFGLTYCLASAIGPVVGGSLAAHGQWRWLFYLNLPISFVACLSVVLFLDLPTPPGNVRDKFWRMDWIGNFLVMASTIAYTIGLTWGGTTAPWSSATVLVPVALGFFFLIAFIVYEATFAANPIVPLVLMTNATSVSGYIQSFCISLNTLAVVYFSPVYFQACKGVSPVLSGIYTLSLCAFAPASILAGFSVKSTGRYRPQMWVAWAAVLAAMCLLSSSTTYGMGMGIGPVVAYLALLGLGSGALYATIVYPIQAPLSVAQNAPALAWMWFLRSFASIWGITIGSTVLENQLSKTLPASLTRSVPSIYALIPELSRLPPSLKLEVQVAFARSLVVLWQVLAAICAVGVMASLFMRGLALTHTLDAAWAIQHREKDQEQEMSAARKIEG